MLRSKPALGPEVPCIQCQRRERGLAWGDYCNVCRGEREAKANRRARRVALIGAALMAAWLLFRLPAAFTPRLFGGLAVLLVYVVLWRGVSRVALEFMPREERGDDEESE